MMKFNILSSWFVYAILCITMLFLGCINESETTPDKIEKSTMTVDSYESYKKDSTATFCIYEVNWHHWNGHYGSFQIIDTCGKYGINEPLILFEPKKFLQVSPLIDSLSVLDTHGNVIGKISGIK